jgi:chaperonin GroES
MAEPKKPKPPKAPARTAARRRPATKHPSEEVRLTGDRVVVMPSEDGERRSRSGLLIPATAAQAPKRCVWAEVALVGPDVRHVRKGDRVLFLPQAGLEVEIDGDERLLLRERDVQAIAAAPADDDHHPPGQYL